MLGQEFHKAVAKCFTVILYCNHSEHRRVLGNLKITYYVELFVSLGIDDGRYVI